MVLQTNASRTFQEDHWVLSYIYLNTVFSCHISVSLEGGKSDNTTKIQQGPKLYSKFTSEKPSVRNGQIIQESSSETSPKTRSRKHLLHESQLGFQPCHSTTLQCMRFTDHLILRYNNNMSMHVASLDTKNSILNETLACYINYST
jgi:hypothetical protein